MVTNSICHSKRISKGRDILGRYIIIEPEMLSLWMPKRLLAILIKKTKYYHTIPKQRRHQNSPIGCDGVQQHKDIITIHSMRS